MELYRKIFIKSEDDLPKEGIECIVHHIAGQSSSIFERLTYNPNKWKEYWMDTIDWYFQPIEQPEIPMKEVADEDRVYFTDNMKFLEILTMWCNIHDFSFSGKESSIITSAVNEYMSQFTTQRQVTDELTYEDFHNAIRTINGYYRKVSGRKECIAFHIKYIQPIEEFIKQHQTTERQ